ncbi:MAG: DUF1963 domain-containing protein [Actinomycetes bacterium]
MPSAPLGRAARSSGRRPERRCGADPCPRAAQQDAAATLPAPEDIDDDRLAAQCEDLDEWLLLADLAGVGSLDSWFGDEGHLEVWVRRADVRARAFDRAWMLVR